MAATDGGMEKEMGDLITIQEVVEISGASESTIRREIKTGKLATSSVSAKVRVYLFDQDDVYAWASEYNRTKPCYKKAA
jgi:hypothetical protein